jgi:hypothetical protein
VWTEIEDDEGQAARLENPFVRVLDVDWRIGCPRDPLISRSGEVLATHRAWRTIEVYEAMQLIRNGQIR